MMVTESWIDRELAGCQFKDMRLGKRFRNCWNSYRMARERAFPSLAKIGRAPRGATTASPMTESKRIRFWRGVFIPHGIALKRQAVSPVLILHDTTEFTHSRTDVE